MHTNKKLQLRLISALLCSVFFAQEISAAPIVVPATSAVSPAEKLLQNPELFEAPLNFTQLSEVHRGTKDVFIIHIQDAHSNYSGQQNMANALEELMRRYNASLIFSEGGEGDCSLTPIKEIAAPNIWKRVARTFLMRGEIQGEEYLNLTSDLPMKIMGIEDMALYKQCVTHYAALAETREKSLDRIHNIEYAVNKLKKRIYPKELVDYELLRRDGHDFQKALPELLRLRQEAFLPRLRGELGKMLDVMEAEKAINFDLANLERATLVEEIFQKNGQESLDSLMEHENGSLSNKVALYGHFQKTLDLARAVNIDIRPYANLKAYVDYLHDFIEIDFDELLKEMEKAEEEVYSKLLVDKNAAILRGIDRFVGLLRAAHEIKMSSDQNATLFANEGDFMEIAVEGFLNRRLAEQGFYDDLLYRETTLEDARGAVRQFYDTVTRRDEAFMQNIEKTLLENDQKIVFLITGGYHTEHLKQLMKAKGYGYAVLTPVIKNETNQSKYESLLLSNQSRKIAVDTAKEVIKSATDQVRVGLLSSEPSGARLAALVEAAAPNADLKKLSTTLMSRRTFLSSAASAAALVAVGTPKISEASTPASTYFDLKTGEAIPNLNPKNDLVSENRVIVATDQAGIEFGTNAVVYEQCVVVMTRGINSSGQTVDILGHFFPNKEDIKQVVKNFGALIRNSDLRAADLSFSAIRAGQDFDGYGKLLEAEVQNQLRPKTFNYKTPPAAKNAAYIFYNFKIEKDGVDVAAYNDGFNALLGIVPDFRYKMTQNGLVEAESSAGLSTVAATTGLVAIAGLALSQIGKNGNSGARLADTNLFDNTISFFNEDISPEKRKFLDIKTALVKAVADEGQSANPNAEVVWGAFSKAALELTAFLGQDDAVNLENADLLGREELAGLTAQFEKDYFLKPGQAMAFITEVKTLRDTLYRMSDELRNQSGVVPQPAVRLGPEDKLEGMLQWELTVKEKGLINSRLNRVVRVFDGIGKIGSNQSGARLAGQTLLVAKEGLSIKDLTDEKSPLPSEIRNFIKDMMVITPSEIRRAEADGWTLERLHSQFKSYTVMAYQAALDTAKRDEAIQGNEVALAARKEALNLSYESSIVMADYEYQRSEFLKAFKNESLEAAFVRLANRFYKIKDVISRPNDQKYSSQARNSEEESTKFKLSAEVVRVKAEETINKINMDKDSLSSEDRTLVSEYSFILRKHLRDLEGLLSRAVNRQSPASTMVLVMFQLRMNVMAEDWASAIGSLKNYQASSERPAAGARLSSEGKEITQESLVVNNVRLTSKILNDQSLIEADRDGIAKLIPAIRASQAKPFAFSFQSKTGEETEGLRVIQVTPGLLEIESEGILPKMDIVIPAELTRSVRLELNEGVNPLSLRTVTDIDNSKNVQPEVERVIRAVGRSALRVIAEPTNYNGSKAIEYRMVVPGNFSSAEESEIRKLVQRVQNFLGGNVSIQVGKNPNDFQDFPGSEDRDHFGVVYLGTLDEGLLRAAANQRAGVAAIARDADVDARPIYFAQLVFSALVQRMTTPTHELKLAWSNLRSDPTVDLTMPVFARLRMVPAGSRLNDFLNLTFRVVALNWKQIISSTYKALQAIGSAA